MKLIQKVTRKYNGIGTTSEVDLRSLKELLANGYHVVMATPFEENGKTVFVEYIVEKEVNE
jgi:hypothetical protein